MNSSTNQCPNGWDNRPSCTHPMCRVHKTEEQRNQSAADWSALIERAKEKES